MTTLKINKEFKELIPPLNTEEYKQLEDNIKLEGCRDTIVTWNNTIVDGHNRYEICSRNDIEFNTKEIDFKDTFEAKDWIIKNQLGRRNLPLYEKAKLALLHEENFKAKAKENQSLGGGDKKSEEAKSGCPKSDKAINSINTLDEVAKLADVARSTIAQVKKIETKATPEQKEQLSKGEASINQVYKEIRKEEKKQERKEYIEQQKEDIEKGNIELPEGEFEVVVIDPPWNYGTTYDPNGRRVANPYPEMNQEELLQLEIPASDNSILFLWTTHRFIFDAKELLEHWGFEYRNIIVWDKEQIGMGDLFRMQCEFCLVGIKGKPILDNDHTNRDIIKEGRREHSRKPDDFYNMVDKLCIGRKLDYFSRSQRDGWCSYGNETQKFMEQPINS